MRKLRYWQTRTHCCGHIVADTNVSPFARARNICCGHKFCVRDTKNVSDFVQKHFASATNVSQFARARKRHEQQCFRNNVSSFASTFTLQTCGLSRRFRERLRYTVEFSSLTKNSARVQLNLRSCTVLLRILM